MVLSQIRYPQRMSASLRSPETLLPQVPAEVWQLLAAFGIDFKPQHEHPSWFRWVVATVVAVAGSLLTDAILVAIGTTVFPSTKGFVHFEFSDYGKLTVIGVVLACVAWPIVCRISSVPRWFFFRLAIVVTLVLWLPDLWILIHGEPIKAVGVLMLMHLAIAFVTYPTLVHVAPTHPHREPIVGRALPLLV
jgi:hypothetical protein